MRSKIVKSTKDFPKLMINEYVVALFSDEENAVVVKELTDTSVAVGRRLSKGSFSVDNFKDFDGVIELSNS